MYKSEFKALRAVHYPMYFHRQPPEIWANAFYKGLYIPCPPEILEMLFSFDIDTEYDGIPSESIILKLNEVESRMRHICNVSGQALTPAYMWEIFTQVAGNEVDKLVHLWVIGTYTLIRRGDVMDDSMYGLMVYYDSPECSLPDAYIPENLRVKRDALICLGAINDPLIEHRRDQVTVLLVDSSVTVTFQILPCICGKIRYGSVLKFDTISDSLKRVKATMDIVDKILERDGVSKTCLTPFQLHGDILRIDECQCGESLFSNNQNSELISHFSSLIV